MFEDINNKLSHLIEEELNSEEKLLKPDFALKSGREILVTYLQTKFKQILEYDKQAKQPVFESSPNAFKIILPKMGVKVVVKDVREDEVLALIKEKGEIVRSDVEELLNVSPATATRLLTKMVDEGQIKRVGSARAIKYFV